MLGNGKFNDLINVRQLHVRLNSVRPHRNKNFEEFANVYREVIAQSVADSVTLTQNSEQNSKNTETCVDPACSIKTIQIEMPILGTEQAIVEAPSKPSTPTMCRRPLLTRDETSPTEIKITRVGSRRLSGKASKLDIRRGIAGLSRKYELVEDGVQVDVDKKFQITVDEIKIHDERRQLEFRKEKELIEDTHQLLKQTKQEVDDSSAQLAVIKSMITNIKLPEKPKKPKTSSQKAKKRVDRHTECLNKKYMSTLKTMHDKLRKLEEKYFSKPQVVYRNVRDICTTYSGDNLLFKVNSSTGTMDIHEAFKGIKQQLDVIANTSLDENHMGIEQLEYNKEVYKEEEYKEENYEQKEYKPQEYEEEEYKPRKYEEKENKPEEIRGLKKTSQPVTLNLPEIEPNTVGDTFDEDKNIMPMKFAFRQPVDMGDQKSNTSMNHSFKMPAFCDELNNLNGLKQTDSDYVRLIDQSEQWFKKNFIRNFDIECFCQKVCSVEDDKTPTHQPNISGDQLASLDPHESESSESVPRVDSAIDKYYHGDSNGFFTKDLQSVISGSVYLSKEFSDVKPNIKVFPNNGRYVQSTNYSSPLTMSNAVPPNLSDLIDNLKFSLQDSIYYKAG